MYHYLINAEGREAMLAQQMNRILEDIDARLNDLEHKASKVGKKPDISRAEKMALLYELGVLDFLLQQGVSQNKIAKLLSLIANASISNIEKDLSTRHNIDASFKNKEAYSFLVKTFGEHGLDKYQSKAKATFEKIESIQGK